MMLPHEAVLVTAPRRTPLGDVPAQQLRERILLALSLLGHRADHPDVLIELVKRVLLGETLLALSSEQVRE